MRAGQEEMKKNHDTQKEEDHTGDLDVFLCVGDVNYEITSNDENKRDDAK